MTEELICKGTPAEIAEAITAQRARLGFFVEQRGEGALIYIVSHSSDEGPYLRHIHLPFALIGPAPDGQSLLTSRAEGDPQPTQWWESLISELGRLGWLASTSEPAHAERVEDAPKPIAAAPIRDLLKVAPVDEESMNLRVRDDELTTNNPRSKLLQSLDKHFSEEDLRTLCFELGVEYDNLPAQGKAGKARELILHLERSGRDTELIDHCRKLRPNISW